MPTDTKRNNDAADDATLREDEPLPAASESEVLDETVRLAREGRRELESDPRERKPASD